MKGPLLKAILQPFVCDSVLRRFWLTVRKFRLSKSVY
jgi:hypothetical protein